MPTDKEAHKDAVTCLYKLHAALQDDLNEMQDPSTSMKGNSSVWVLCRYGLLATKEAEATKLKQHITIQSEQHEQAKRGWEDEERSLRETIVSLKLLVEEKEGFADETKRQLMAAEQENAVLRETSKEREKFISTMLAENEKTLKLHVNGTNEAALIMDVDQTQHKATHENIEQLRLTAKYLDSYSSDISQAINELTKEVRSMEESQGACEAMMLSLSGNEIQHDCPSAFAQHDAMLHMCDQVGSLQSQCIDLSNKLSVAEALLQKRTEEKRTIKSQLHQMVINLGDVFTVMKYQESSLCGTQTIDAMQLSIASLSAEFENERQTLLQQIETQTAAAMGVTTKHQVETEALQSKILDLERTIEDKDAQIGRLKVAMEKLRSEKSPMLAQNKSPILATAELNQSMPTTPLPVDLPPAPVSLTTIPTEAVAIDTAVVIPDVCLACREEPFGFMVRCQKCKQQFHAGCVRSKRQKTSRVGCYVFVCDQCEV
ncbi:hypothetical protein Ae201684P_004228 [Aphanomyces euteiches]|nr:hypothetical protein Ae201684P_004228 [Aphanomyces euteiches]